MNRQIVDQLPWLISRAAGLGSFAAFSAVIILGLLAASRLLPKLGIKQQATLTTFHRQIAFAGWALLATHVISLLFDQWLKPAWWQLLDPFALNTPGSFYLGLGALAAASIAGASLTPALARRLRGGPWKRLHRILPAAAYLALAGHIIGAGSDLRSGAAHYALAQLFIFMALVLGLRFLGWRLQRAAAAT